MDITLDGSTKVTPVKIGHSPDMKTVPVCELSRFEGSCFLGRSAVFGRGPRVRAQANHPPYRISRDSKIAVQKRQWSDQGVGQLLHRAGTLGDALRVGNLIILPA